MPSRPSEAAAWNHPDERIRQIMHERAVREELDQQELRIAKDSLLAVADIALAAIEAEQTAHDERVRCQGMVYESINNASQDLLESLSLQEREALQESLEGFVPQIEPNQVH